MKPLCGKGFMRFVQAAEISETGEFLTEHTEVQPGTEFLEGDKAKAKIQEFRCYSDYIKL
jgi:hypothetical protein